MTARPHAEALLARLIAFDTTSRNSNRALIDFVRDYLDGFGIAAELIESPDGDKANLFATLGDGRDGGVVLSGHTDVVPVDGQDWSDDPFRLRERDGLLYGRGTCDMKGFIACALAQVPALAESRLARPVHLALSYDEEVGCIGAPYMIARMREAGYTPEAVLVGEPTMMDVVPGHKGLIAMRTHVCGHAAHSSQAQQGVSAVMLAGRLVERLAAEAERRRTAGPHDDAYTPDWTTVTVNQIRGGTAVNILAGECEFTWDIRHLPDDDPDVLLADFARFCAQVRDEARRISPRVRIASTELARVPALRAEVDGAAHALACALSDGDRAAGAAYCTEGGQFQRAGYSAVVCGPGSVAQAHQPDEYVSREQLARCGAFIERLVARQQRRAA